jgi:hypothetical protein
MVEIFSATTTTEDHLITEEAVEDLIILIDIR